MGVYLILEKRGFVVPNIILVHTKYLETSIYISKDCGKMLINFYLPIVCSTLRLHIFFNLSNLFIKLRMLTIIWGEGFLDRKYHLYCMVIYGGSTIFSAFGYNILEKYWDKKQFGGKLEALQKYYF